MTERHCSFWRRLCKTLAIFQWIPVYFLPTIPLEFIFQLIGFWSTITQQYPKNFIYECLMRCSTFLLRYYLLLVKGGIVVPQVLLWCDAHCSSVVFVHYNLWSLFSFFCFCFWVYHIDDAWVTISLAGMDMLGPHPLLIIRHFSYHFVYLNIPDQLVVQNYS